ncbi:MAG TPA: PHB depolymerase family esterase, partial [Dermatophilaceae bacterium]|nr:PHB depolymerase family esterase [Dermatophilaceae bacterium]
GAALTLVLIAAACGGSDDSGGSETTTTVRSTSSTGEEATTGPAEPVRSSGCGSSTTAAATEEKRSVDVAGTERDYLLTTPAQHDGTTPLPLVLDIHGLAEGSTVHSRMTGYSALAQQEGFVAAFPNGLGTPQRWDVDVTDPANPDLAYIDQLLDRVGQELCIDTSRVYATGLSMGGWFTSTLGCTRSDRIAAIAPVSGVLYQDGCRPERPVPVRTFHGTADPILLFNGGIGQLTGLMTGATTADQLTLAPADINGAGYPAAVRSWAEHNECTPTPKETRPSAGVLLRVYSCPDGADVEFSIIEGGGHSWPGSAFSQSIEKIVGPTNMDLDATRLTWDFMSQFHLPAG